MFSGRPFGSAQPYGCYLVAPTPEGANKLATPAIDRMAFVFNLLLGIIGGDGCLSASRPVTKRAFFMLPISQIRASGGPFDLIEGDPPTLPFLDRRAAPVLLMRTAMLRVVDERRAGHAVRGCHNCSDGLVDPTAIAINEVLSGARSAFTGTGPDRRSTSSMKARQQRGDVMNQAASWQPSYSLCEVSWSSMPESLPTQPVIKPSFSSSSTNDLSNTLSFRRYGAQ